MLIPFSGESTEAMRAAMERACKFARDADFIRSLLKQYEQYSTARQLIKLVSTLNQAETVPEFIINTDAVRVLWGMYHGPTRLPPSPMGYLEFLESLTPAKLTSGEARLFQDFLERSIKNLQSYVVKIRQRNMH